MKDRRNGTAKSQVLEIPATSDEHGRAFVTVSASKRSHGKAFHILAEGTADLSFIGEWDKI